MATMIGKGTDVVDFLKSQHTQIKAGFERVLAAQAKERERAFTDLRRLLAVHETAEEEIVHPAARRALREGDVIVSARLREENEAKKALARLEKMDVMSRDFESDFRVLQGNVIAHAEAEEREEFSALATALEPERLERMRKAAELAESIAPTRPHAGVESATANLLVGPFMSMVDRTRDALSGKH
ncbi:MAG: Hemerythrin cation binding protein [Myxococcaceae bacterium]|jgi:hypothetical protein|nr:Hemerythrin cation binding protein [Myxococcaceae bacterium]MEA2751363.1 hypothetical protein [Myxococcales bacterium]